MSAAARRRVSAPFFPSKVSNSRRRVPSQGGCRFVSGSLGVPGGGAATSQNPVDAFGGTMINRLVALAACVLCLGAAAFAQTVTGTLQGTVRDPNGAVVPGATVLIRNVETGQERTATTNDEGLYVATFLPVGRYDVTGSGRGFGSVRREGVEVLLNQTVNAEFSLS